MTTEGLRPFRLRVDFVERVWGKLDLAPWYSERFDQPVGEAWLTGETCVVETGPHAGRSLAQMQDEFGEQLHGKGQIGFPLLVKTLFPQEKLSVQVHPNDEDAAALGGEVRAKTECWYVLEADAGASVSLGLKAGTTEAQVREALGNESFEALLHREPVVSGDMVYVEAGTVHAIGGGVVILEVQQTSDTTYRLYDYGRPRELHLEDGMKVIQLQTAAGKITPRLLPHGTELIHVEHFSVDRLDVPAGASWNIGVSGTPQCVVALQNGGAVVFGGEKVALHKGQAIVIPAVCESYAVEGECTVVRCGLPG